MDTKGEQSSRPTRRKTEVTFQAGAALWLPANSCSYLHRHHNTMVPYRIHFTATMQSPTSCPFLGYWQGEAHEGNGHLVKAPP